MYRGSQVDVYTRMPNLTGLRGEPWPWTLSGGFSAARRGTIKSNFTVAPQAGTLCLFQMNSTIFTL